MTLGGRLAEELIFGEDLATTGASNDIEQVANIAKRMVKEWGMSSKVGTVVVSTTQQGGFMQPRSPWGLQMLGLATLRLKGWRTIHTLRRKRF